MATHNPEREMTVTEAVAEYKYMQPDAVFCEGKRVGENEYSRLMLDYIEVSSGIVYYYAHRKEEAVVCECCGCVVASEDAVEVDGRVYCKECCAECYECGEWVVKDDDGVFCDENGEWYCRDCADAELIFCEHCERYMLDIYAHRVRVGARYSEVWCEECIDDDALLCDDCDEVYGG